MGKKEKARKPDEGFERKGKGKEGEEGEDGKGERKGRKMRDFMYFSVLRVLEVTADGDSEIRFHLLLLALLPVNVVCTVLFLEPRCA